MLDRVMTKLTSARFLIAVITTIVFAILACTSRLTTEFLSVYTLVIAFYYNKDRTNIDVKEDDKTEV